MFKKGNHNLFVGDRAYQTDFFLNFKSGKSEHKFQSDTFARTKFFLQGYVIISFIYLIWSFFNSTCYNFYHNCKHPVFVIVSMTCLISTFPTIKNSQALLTRLLLLIPSLYIHLILIDTYNYHLTAHLIVIQTALASKILDYTNETNFRWTYLPWLEISISI